MHFQTRNLFHGFLMQNCQSWWLFLTLSRCSSRCENFYVERNGNEVFQNLSHSCSTAPILFFFVQTYLLRWHNKYPIDFNNVFQQNDGLLSLVQRWQEAINTDLIPPFIIRMNINEQSNIRPTYLRCRVAYRIKKLL